MPRSQTLKLHRETLRVLSEDAASWARGGSIMNTNTSAGDDTSMDGTCGSDSSGPTVSAGNSHCSTGTLSGRPSTVGTNTRPTTKG